MLSRMLLRAVFIVCLSALPFYGQGAPRSPEKPWAVPDHALRQLEGKEIDSRLTTVDPRTIYTLPQLVDLAEQNNPQTRIAWERAKQRAATLGVAESALFPTVAAIASTSINQYSLFNGKFNHENTALFPESLSLTYTVFDFGHRDARIDVAKASLLAANFSFNNTHRDLAFHVAEAYYRLLDALSQEDAARSALKDAQILQDAVETRLANGLATSPDALEARASAAEARYELASTEGLEESARGDLATVLGIPPSAMLQIQDLSTAPLPANLEAPVQSIMDRALKQRPDLLAQVSRLTATEAGVRQARSAFGPVLAFSGSWGHSNAFGQQRGGPEVHSAVYPYQAQFNLSWTVFDGGARKNEANRARAGEQEARAQFEADRDRVENEVWTAYTHLKTAQDQEAATEALLAAAQQSYAAAMDAFQAGVRTFLDVSSAQRRLARARAASVAARVRLLSSIAELAYRSAEPIPGAQH